MSRIRQHILLLGALLATASAATLGNYVTPCKAKDPNINECVRQAAQDLFVRAAYNGIPELQIRALEGVTVPKLELAKQAGALNMNLEFTNSTHSGLGKIKVKSASVNPHQHEYNFTVVIPKYDVVGNYDINGRVILLPINGRGTSNLTFTDIEANWNFIGETEEREGKKYLKLKTLRTTILPDSPKSVKVHFDGLFGGNKVLGDTMNDFLNTNWHEVSKQLNPNIQATFDRRMLPLAQRFVSHFPLEQLFPDL